MSSKKSTGSQNEQVSFFVHEPCSLEAATRKVRFRDSHNLGKSKKERERAMRNDMTTNGIIERT